MTVRLDSLRVGAEFDASAYTTGAAQKVAADASMVASNQRLAQSAISIDTKISQSGDMLSRLSRQYVEGYASAQKMTGALNQLARGIDTGRISAEQMGPILDGIYRKYNLIADASQFAQRGQTGLATAMIQANTKVAEAQRRLPANANRLSSGQLQGLGYQANDVITMALMGASPGQIAVSQGGQILQTLQMGEGGIKGSLSAMKTGAVDATKAAAALLGTVGLISTGFGVAAVAAGAFYLLTRDKSKDLNEALKDERQFILDVADAYDLAKVNAENYNKSAGAFAEAAARKGQGELSGAARSEDIDVLNSLAAFATSGQTRGGRFGFVASGQYEARSRYAAFNDPISAFAKSVSAGAADYDALAKGVQAVVAQNPGLKSTGDEILNIAANGNKAAAALREAADTLARINSRAPSLADAQLGQEYREQNDAKLFWLQQQRDASLFELNARSPEERRRAAMATEGARPSADNENNDVRDFKIATAGALAYEQAIHQIDEAQKQRAAALSQYVDGSDLGDLFGDAA